MKIFSTYSVKIKNYSNIFKATVSIYRDTIDYLINICLFEWDELSVVKGNKLKLSLVEHLCHETKNNIPKYENFDKKFYKMPTYLRRAAINEAIGKVSSYKSNLANWEAEDVKTRGRKPSFPKAGKTYPCLYKDNMYKITDTYEAKIKVFVNNTWDWITVQLRKTDIDYINRRCFNREQCAPTLQKRGKQWFLDFPFEENTKLNDTDVFAKRILAVDLGLNSSATVSVMRSDGTVLDRKFLKLSKEYDSLTHALNRVKKAQQHGNHKTPRLWAKVNGINQDIAVKTANFIIDEAILYSVDTIVFEHLNKKGKLKGFKKQRLALWKSQTVQKIVENKAHRCGMRISRINAWGTSKLAFDGSGYVKRGKDADLPSYSLCEFPSGKVYNCDLSASYNIGARYLIREILKSLPVKERLALEAKVPQAAKRSTCTLSTLINLNAALMSLAA